MAGSESSNAHATGSHVRATATSGRAAKSRLAAAFDLKVDEKRQLLGDKKGSSSHKRRTSGSSKSHGKRVTHYIYQCMYVYFI